MVRLVCVVVRSFFWLWVSVGVLLCVVLIGCVWLCLGLVRLVLVSVGLDRLVGCFDRLMGG